MRKLSKNFLACEFVCHCGKCPYSDPETVPIDSRLIQALQIARDSLGAPITITSGLRCPEHNKKVGGVANSYHTKGEAADLRAGNMTRLFEVLTEIKLLEYIEVHDNYIHVDIGKKRYRRIRDLRTVKPSREK